MCFIPHLNFQVNVFEIVFQNIFKFTLPLNQSGAITQNFEVMEHKQSVKSWLKKCKFTVRKCLVEFAEKCVLEHQKRMIFNPKMSGTQGWILEYFVVSLIHLTLCI